MAGTAKEHAVDEQVLLNVPHGLPDIHIIDEPAMLTEEPFDGMGKVIVLQGIVVTYESGIIVEYNFLGLMVAVILTHIIYQLRQFALVFGEERLEDAQLAVVTHLPYHTPVDVGIGIEGKNQR